jgi:hypothetical protein
MNAKTSDELRAERAARNVSDMAWLLEDARGRRLVGEALVGLGLHSSLEGDDVAARTRHNLGVELLNAAVAAVGIEKAMRIFTEYYSGKARDEDDLRDAWKAEVTALGLGE